MAYAQPNICPGKWDVQTLLGFQIQTDPLISTRQSDIIIMKKKKMRTLLSKLTTEKKWRKVKRRISTSPLLGNLKNVEHESDGDTNCNWGSCHQKIDTRTRRHGNNWIKWKLFKVLHYWDGPEYWVESWRLEETFSHSNSSEGPSALADVKISQWI